MIRVLVKETVSLRTFEGACVRDENIYFYNDGDDGSLYYECESFRDAINKLKQITKDGYFIVDELHYKAPKRYGLD